MAISIRRAASNAGLIAATFGVAMVPVFASAATDTANTVINATVGSTISVTSTSPVALSLTPTTSSVLTSASDTVTVNTNNTAGYTLTLQDVDANTDLVSGGNSFTAIAQTPSTAAALGDDEWGFAVAALGGTNFDGSYSVESNSTTSTSTWAAVPASGSPFTLKTTGTTATNDTTTVWYAAKASTSQPTGTYTDTVVYTATTN